MLGYIHAVCAVHAPSTPVHSPVTLGLPQAISCQGQPAQLNTDRAMPFVIDNGAMSLEETQRDIALDLISALVFREDERVGDLCTDRSTYSAFLSPARLPALDDSADSPVIRMKQLMGNENNHAAHGWAPLSNTTLHMILDSRLRAYGTSTLCKQRILGIMQRENVCAIRFQEINRTGGMDKTSVMRLHFNGVKVDAIDEYIDARRSFGFEPAVGLDDWSSSAPSSPASMYST